MICKVLAESDPFNSCLWSNVNGLSLLGSDTMSESSLTLATMDKSSTYFNDMAAGLFFLEKKGQTGLGICGRRAAPLK